MADLILQHKVEKTHKEYWTIKDDGVHIKSVCPNNHPSNSEFEMTPCGALKMYALMTSGVEGWEVISESENWHAFVDEIEIED